MTYGSYISHIGLTPSLRVGSQGAGGSRNFGLYGLKCGIWPEAAVPGRQLHYQAKVYFRRTRHGPTGRK
jgi:hypothetical protein